MARRLGIPKRPLGPPADRTGLCRAAGIAGARNERLPGSSAGYNVVRASGLARSSRRETMQSQRDDRFTEGRRRDVRARASVAAPAVVIGSIVVIVGALLDWATGTGGTTVFGVQTTTAGLNGYNMVDGRIVGALGVALLIAGLILWANRRVGTWFASDL